MYGALDLAHDQEHKNFSDSNVEMRVLFHLCNPALAESLDISISSFSLYLVLSTINKRPTYYFH